MKTHIAKHSGRYNEFTTFCGEEVEIYFTVSLEQFHRWIIGDLAMYCENCIELIPIIMLNED